MRILFLFIDGVGLGDDEPEYNPLARAEMPNLQALLGGRRLVRESAPYAGERASLLALDSRMGVAGLPQSATGQASFLTGQNIPGEIGYHYGPKPNPEVAGYVENGNLFRVLKNRGKEVRFLNAYPPRYFEGITSGRRLYSAVPLAAVSAGLRLMDGKDLSTGNALSADLSGQGWRDHLGELNTPVISLREAGARLSDLSAGADFSFFEYWLSDYAGHAQDMPGSLTLLSGLDEAVGGLLSAWKDEEGLALITSDHGNLEDLRTRRHTSNPVPAVLIGARGLRERFSEGLENLADVGRNIIRILQ